MITQHAVHEFYDIDHSPFSVSDYSKLKFGSDKVAKKFGYDLADSFAEKHLPMIIGRTLLIIPSPYNYIKNAATIMTEHFIDRLNHISVTNSGHQVESSIIHRRCSYFNDYGFLSKEDRTELLNGDDFYINEEFLKDKVLIFVDDVIITGTHEDKIKEILKRKNIQNDSVFLYYAQYLGSNPEIESELNFASIKSLDEYALLSHEEDHHTIIRPLKYILKQNKEALKKFLDNITRHHLERIYYGCLAEGYYKLPDFQTNFGLIRKHFEAKL